MIISSTNQRIFRSFSILHSGNNNRKIEQVVFSSLFLYFGDTKKCFLKKRIRERELSCSKEIYAKHHSHLYPNQDLSKVFFNILFARAIIKVIMQKPTNYKERRGTLCLRRCEYPIDMERYAKQFILKK